MRRLLAAAAAGLLMLAVLAGCSSDDTKSVDTGRAKVEEDGDRVTVDDGDSAISVGGTELPDEFPKRDVPLPEGGTLQMVFANRKAGERSYTLSYGIDDGDVAGAANDYKAALIDDHYRIEASASAGAAAAVFSAYTAIGSEWDVIVYSGGSTATDAVLALQITPHRASNDLPGAETGDSG